MADYGDNAVPSAGLNPTGGLVVSCSGIWLGTVGRSLNLQCAVFFPYDHTNGLIVSRFRESETGKGFAAWDQSKEFALISYTPVKKLLHTPGSQSIAIIGTREDHAELDSLQINYICRVTLIQSNKETMNACK